MTVQSLRRGSQGGESCGAREECVVLWWWSDGEEMVLLVRLSACEAVEACEVSIRGRELART